MKKIYIAHILLLIATATSAQVSKNSWMSSLNGRIARMDKTKVWHGDIHPQFGYVPINNLVIGIGVDHYWFNQSTSQPGQKAKIGMIGGGPFVRYYSGKGKLKAFGHVQCAYTHSYMKVPYPGRQYNFGDPINQLTSNMGVGIAFFAGNRGSIDLSATYCINDMEYAYNYSSYIDIYSTWRIRLGCTIFLGSDQE